MTASPTFSLPCRFLAVALVLFGLWGCSGLAGVNRDTFKPYVPEVVQCNFISKEQRQVLSRGMARVQVVAECEHPPEQIGEHATLASGIGHLVACVRQLAQRRGARGYSRR